MKLHFRRNEAPDYLRRVADGYFNRGGFCFAVGTEVMDGVCRVVVHFQNQRDAACVGQVAIRPARTFLLGRADLPSVAVRICCPPAAYGIARVPLPVPAAFQGQRQAFEVGASVSHPDGRGRQVRFRDGTLLRANADFGNAVGTTLTVASALIGRVHYESPAAVTLQLPVGVADELPVGLATDVETMWEWGDAPLKGWAER